MTAKIDKLTPKEVRLVQGMKAGLTQGEAGRLAGYSPRSCDAVVSETLRKDKMQRALDKAGLTQDALTKDLKTSLRSGLGIKSTNSDSLRALELCYKLRGDLTVEKPDYSQINSTINIKELKLMSNEQLSERLNILQGELIDLNR